MITVVRPQDGYSTFRPDPLVVRNGTVLTTGYVLCEAHNNQDVRHGDIDVSAAKNATLWLGVAFGALTSIEIKPVFRAARNPGLASAALADIASTQASGWLTVTSATGGFTPQMVGRLFRISAAGTNFTVGLYYIVAVVDANTIVVDRACGSTGDASGGTGTVLSPEFQDLAMATTTGVSVASPHVVQVAATSGDGQFTVTLPLPAASFMRLYAKGTGTVTGSQLWMGVTLMPPGGV
jgi:hypothetical protein